MVRRLEWVVCLYIAASVAAQDGTNRESFIDLMIPRAMSEVEFEWYIDTLDVSEGQRERLGLAFFLYEDGAAADLRERRAELRNMSRKVSEANRVSQDRGVAAYEAAMNARGEFISLLDNLDAAFVLNVEAALGVSGGGDEAEKVEFVRQNRRRFRLGAIRSFLPGADSDYVDVCLSLKEVAFDHKLVELCTRYSARLTPLREKREKLSTKHSVLVKHLTAIMAASASEFPGMPREDFDAMRRSAFEQRSTLIHDLYKVDKDLKSVNKRYADMFRAALAEQQMDVPFDQRRRRIEYPMVYPDRVCAIPVVEKSLDFHLSDDVRGTVESHLEQARERHALIGRRLEKRTDEWRDLSGRTLMFKSSEQQQYLEDMVALEQERLELSERSAAFLRAVLPTATANNFIELHELEVKQQDYDPRGRYFPR